MDTLKNIINLDLKITEPPEPEPPPAIAAKAVVQSGNSETGEINPNFVYDDDSIVEPELPEFKPKPKPDTDIFIEEEPTPPKLKVVPEAKPVKLNKNGKPRKKMSSEHLDKLKLAREKAAAKKRFLKEERLKVKKEKDDMKNKKESLIKEKEQLDMTELEQQVQQKKKIKETPPTPLPVQLPKVEYPPITMDDIQQASLNAILKVEALRKERKAEKKKKATIDQYNQQTMKSLNKMEAKQPSWYIKDSPYNGLF
jgi:hypothetical protein